MSHKLSTNFTLEEFLCRCCGKGDGLIHPNLVIGLQMLRDLVKRPVVISCAYRCPKHNKAVGGHSQSWHLQGIAADIYVLGFTPQELGGVAARVPLFFNGGIGVYPPRGFIHVDVGPKRRWLDMRSLKPRKS